jgi:hypothetical protein
MTDWSDFGSRVVYEMEGWIHKDINNDTFTRATEAQVTTEADLKFDEVFEANIINLDSWLRESWTERMAREIDLGGGRTFTPDWDEVTVRLDLRSDEVVKAAEQRAGEDATEAAYVLGNWVYLAEKRDHIPSAMTLRTAFERVNERRDQPDDATTEEYGGGRR